MRNHLMWAGVAFLTGTFAFAQQPQATPGQSSPQPTQQATPATQPPPNQAPMSPELQELTNLFDAKIHGEWEAIKHKDQKAYGEYLTDDFIGVETDREGERYKWKAQAELQNSMVNDYQLSFLKVTPLCPEAAFVRYEAFIKFPPNSALHYEKVLIGEVWVKRDGQWKLMHYQETNVK